MPVTPVLKVSEAAINLLLSTGSHELPLSKSTSFSSTLSILKANSNILWLLGGINKKGDKFNLKKKELNNVRAFIYGKKKNFFNKQLKNKLKSKNFSKLKDALKSISYLVKKEKGPVTSFKNSILVNALPKTRSGKILRSTIRKIVDKEKWDMPPTIENPEIFEEIIGKIKELNFE